MSSKTVLITGCSSGFGRQMVSDFLKAGWTVIATLRNAAGRSEIFWEEMSRFRERLKVLELDVTSSRDREELDRELAARCPNGLDCLVNNAGYGLFGALEDLSEEQIRKQMEVNFFGLALLTQKLLPHLRKARGRIINLSSVFGFVGFPLTSAYCASKFAVEGLSESLRLELEPYGVQVAIVEPGGHRTRFGESVIWGEKSFDLASPYLPASRGYSRFKEERQSQANPATAVAVSEAVLRLTRCSRMPARVVCGKDAKGMAFLRQRGLSAKLAEGILLRVYRKKFLGARA